MLDTKSHTLPLTQGGLEIICNVTMYWRNKEKFGILTKYIDEHYSLEKANQDDSKYILAEIKDKLNLKDLSCDHADSESDKFDI